MSTTGTWATIGLFFAALSLPLAAGSIGFDRPTTVDPTENRTLAGVPTLPANAADLLSFPSRAEAYANDHLPSRAQLIGINNQVRYNLFSEVASPQITVGRDNHLFFNSHTAQDPLSMIRFLCGESTDEARIDKIAHRLSSVLSAITARAPSSTVMFVPTKSVIYFEEMPVWLQERCRQSVPAMPRVLARLADLAPANRQHVHYPAEAMRAMRANVEIYPRTNFHWVGAGARAVADDTAATLFSQRPRQHLEVHPVVVRSDLQAFVPGVPLSASSEVVDFAGAGITACRGGSCFPEFGEAAPVLGDIGRFESRYNAGPRLLILSDSFGAGIAGYFSAYFGSVWHVSGNEAQRLSKEQLKKVRTAVLDTFAPQHILYIVHDFSVQYFNDFLQPLP